MKKVPKPVVRANNAGAEPKKFTLQKAERLANFDKLNQTDIPTSTDMFDDSQGNLTVQDMTSRSSRSGSFVNTLHTKTGRHSITMATDTSMLQLEDSNPYGAKQSNFETQQRKTPRGGAKPRFSLIMQPKALLSQKMPLFQRMMFKKKGVEAQAQTATKDYLRYIAFDQGRILVLKQLRGKLEGDKITSTRNFPSFQRSVGGSTNFKMPTIIWNAKIVRIYKVNQLQYIKWLNYQ